MSVMQTIPSGKRSLLYMVLAYGLSISCLASVPSWRYQSLVKRAERATARDDDRQAARLYKRAYRLSRFKDDGCERHLAAHGCARELLRLGLMDRAKKYLELEAADLKNHDKSACKLNHERLAESFEQEI